MTKMIPRLHAPGQFKTADIFTLPSDRAHYLRDVLRLDNGDEVRLFNEERGEWSASIVKSGKRAVELQINTLLRPPVAEADTWLVFAPIKRTPLEWMLEKATELGVSRLVPVITEHTQVRNLNVERLADIVTSAAEQCERLSVPAISQPQSLAQLLGSWKESRKLIATLERSDAKTLHDLKNEQKNDLPKAASSAILIGPEGGFSDNEKALLQKQNFISPVSLGNTILRAETAAIAALAIYR